MTYNETGLVPLVTLTLSYVRGTVREAAALVETLTSEPGVIPDPTLVLLRVYLYRPGNR